MIQSGQEGFGSIRTLQRELVMGVLRALVVVAPFVAVVGSYYDYMRGVYASIPLYWVAYGILLVVTFWRRVPYALQVFALVLLLYSLAVLDFLSDGRGGSGRIFLLVLPFAASVFYNTRRGVVAMGLIVVTMAAMAWGFSSGTLTVMQEIDSSDLLGWISNTLVLILVGAFMLVSHNHIVPRMAQALRRGDELRVELERERATLETEVGKRTADLARRNLALQAAAQVARDAAGIRNVEQVVEETVMLVSDAFGYYHCGIFMIEEYPGSIEGSGPAGGRYAVLQAASSREGEAMLAAGHRLRLGEGVVGDTAASGRPHVALDVGADRVYFDNPYLPDTRSEVAVPLRLGDDVIGVLDVQSREEAAFDEGDMAVLQTLADQITLAIGNARLLEELEGRMEAEQQMHGELSKAAWRALLSSGGQMWRRYDPKGVLGQKGGWHEGTTQAAAEGRRVTDVVDGLPAMAVPVKVRGHVIGVLDARKPAGGGEWSEHESSLLETLVDQLAVALDGARLFQETQERAARERLIGEVTARVRETLDMRTVIETAASELYEQLGLEKVTIYLSAEEGAPGNGAGSDRQVTGSAAGGSE